MTREKYLSMLENQRVALLKVWEAREELLRLEEEVRKETKEVQRGERAMKFFDEIKYPPHDFERGDTWGTFNHGLESEFCCKICGRRQAPHEGRRPWETG